MLNNALQTIGGSSPRMWGTRNLSYCQECFVRFIPTHVGNTRQTLERARDPPVHPHACGEHGCEDEGGPAILGSSPRMWGTPYSSGTYPSPLRFIPTHVGNTHTSKPPPSRRSVHPHACGEHSLHKVCSSSAIGSSPRMWGTHHKVKSNNHQNRFIPTHVGNTESRYPSRLQIPVHPHACGEHITKDNSLGCVLGSSPRMWGTLDT
mgnify:CR=1 FL=1